VSQCCNLIQHLLVEFGAEQIDELLIREIIYEAILKAACAMIG